MRAYIDWGVLRETEDKGLYRGAAKRTIEDVPLTLWTIKAMLFATDDTPRPASTLLRGPHLFPFELALPSFRNLETCTALELSRHGLDQEVLLGLSKPASIV